MTRILIIFIVLLFGSCRTIQYVPVETVRTDSLYINKVERDSIIVRDSIYVHDKGDTVFVNKYKYIYKDKIATDTIFINKTDTIRVPYPVEKEPTFWEKTKQSFRSIIVFIIVILSIFVIGKAVKRVR